MHVILFININRITNIIKKTLKKKKDENYCKEKV